VGVCVFVFVCGALGVHEASLQVARTIRVARVCSEKTCVVALLEHNIGQLGCRGLCVGEDAANVLYF
jgi:hypothetical protein